MATLPQATVTVDATATAVAQGSDLLAVIAPVATSADTTPRLFSSVDALLSRHGFAPGVDYVAHHIADTGKPVLFTGIPVATAGTIGAVDTSGNTGTSGVTLSGTPLDEIDLQVTVKTGGTIGTDQIYLTISTDGGYTTFTARLGTATTYAIPYSGLTLTFVSGGTLVADDVILTGRTTGPRWNQAGVAAARTALAASSYQTRSWFLSGDLATEQDATDVLTEANGYASTDERFVYVATQAPDARKAPTMSRRRVAMTGSPSLTFAEVGATGDTITRSAGSFITDGFAVGDVITVSGAVASSGANNVTGPIASLTATVITLGTTDLIDEGPITGCAIVGSPGITFAEVGATGDTITRSSGSWVLDGFQVGDIVTIDGTASNDVTTDAITGVSATVLTLNTTDLTAEVIGSHSITITAPAETLAEVVAANDALLGDIDDQKRIDIAHGRARKVSPITNARRRRPSSWPINIRAYQKDLSVATYRKADGALDGWTVEDSENNTVEHDERITGGALAARFSCLRTYGNGPAGVFVALALTRASDNTILSRTHNMAVTNLACQTVQAETERAIGRGLKKNANGTLTNEAAARLEFDVNNALRRALLVNPTGEIENRASGAVWRASRTDDLSLPGATLTGTLALTLNATIENIATSTKVS